MHLAIFGDHSDVYGLPPDRLCYALLQLTVQEVMDLGAVAHLSTYRRQEFLSFTSSTVSEHQHEIQKVEVWDYEDTRQDALTTKAVDAFRSRALNPEHPVLRGTAQNPDIFFQAREASNKYYEATPAIVREVTWTR